LKGIPPYGIDLDESPVGEIAGGYDPPLGEKKDHVDSSGGILSPGRRESKPAAAKGPSHAVFSPVCGIGGQGDPLEMWRYLW